MGEPCQPCRRPNPGFHQPKLGIAPKTYEGELKQTKIRILPKKKLSANTFSLNFTVQATASQE
jgi:hypothetical protein